MAEPNVPHRDGIRFVRDGFRPFAFVLPVVWLVWNRLWLHAALAFAAMGITSAVAQALVPQALPVVAGLVNFGLGLLTALEGPAWLAANLERKGHVTEDAIAAASLREAEEIYASRLAATVSQPNRPGSGFQPVSQASLIPLAGA